MEEPFINIVMEHLDMSNLAEVWKQSTPIEEDLTAIWEQSQPIEQAKAPEQVTRPMDTYDELGLPVGEPEMLGKAVNLPYEPLQQVLRSPGAVTEAGLAERPEALEEKEASILDIAGMAGRATEKILPGGFTAEDAGGDITMTPQLREKIAQLTVEFGAMHPYTVGMTKILGNVVRTGKAAIKSFDVKIASEVEKGITKGIRPSVAGKKSAPDIQRYLNKSNTAVQEIIKNKKALSFIDKSGKTITGQLPENLKEFSQAISQTLKNKFNEYNALAIAAGEKGATVNLEPIAEHLLGIAKDKITKTMNPDVAAFAEKFAERLMADGVYTAEEAQKAIATLNDGLKSFFKNPTFENANKAYVQSEVTHKLRSSLDAVIENATGTKYAKLKREYGALKTIEKDVAHRVQIDARKSPLGLVDMSDIFTGFHAVKGVITLDPVTVTASVFAKGIAKGHKIIVDPNRIIKKMFKKTDELMRKRSAFEMPVKSTPKVTPEPKQIEWQGVIRESGESIPLRKGEQHAEYVPPGLIKPSWDKAKSAAPPKIKTTIQPAMGKVYPEKEVPLRPDQVATLRKRFKLPSSKTGMPLIMPATRIIKSKAPIKLKAAIYEMSESVPMKNIEVVLRPDQGAVLRRRKIPISKKGQPLYKPSKINAGSFK